MAIKLKLSFSIGEVKEEMIQKLNLGESVGGKLKNIVKFSGGHNIENIWIKKDELVRTNFLSEFMLGGKFKVEFEKNVAPNIDIYLMDKISDSSNFNLLINKIANINKIIPTSDITIKSRGSKVKGLEKLKDCKNLNKMYISENSEVEGRINLKGTSINKKNNVYTQSLDLEDISFSNLPDGITSTPNIIENRTKYNDTPERPLQEEIYYWNKLNLSENDKELMLIMSNVVYWNKNNIQKEFRELFANDNRLVRAYSKPYLKERVSILKSRLKNENFIKDLNPNVKKLAIDIASVSSKLADISYNMSSMIEFVDGDKSDMWFKGIWATDLSKSWTDFLVGSMNYKIIGKGEEWEEKRFNKETRKIEVIKRIADRSFLQNEMSDRFVDKYFNKTFNDFYSFRKEKLIYSHNEIPNVSPFPGKWSFNAKEDITGAELSTFMQSVNNSWLRAGSNGVYSFLDININKDLDWHFDNDKNKIGWKNKEETSYPNAQFISDKGLEVLRKIFDFYINN